jgi:hypothetical protein
MTTNVLHLTNKDSWHIWYFLMRFQNNVLQLIIQVLTAASMKMAVFIALMMGAADTSKTSVNFYHTTRRNNPEDSHLRCAAR